MTIMDERPHLVAVCKDSSIWRLRPEDAADFTWHWTQSKPFWSGVDCWGQSVIVKLGDITGLILETDASIARKAADFEEQRMRAVIDGTDE